MLPSEEHLRFVKVLADLSFCPYFPVHTLARKGLKSLVLGKEKTTFEIVRALSVHRKIEKISMLLRDACTSIDIHEKEVIAETQLVIPSHIFKIASELALCDEFKDEQGNPLDDKNAKVISHFFLFQQESRLLVASFLSMNPPTFVIDLVFRAWNKILEDTKAFSSSSPLVNLRQIRAHQLCRWDTSHKLALL